MMNGEDWEEIISGCLIGNARSVIPHELPGMFCSILYIYILSAALGGVQIDETSEHQKKEDNSSLKEVQHDHILLRVGECAHRNILLHHFLVESGHGYGNECAAYDLLQEELT